MVNDIRAASRAAGLSRADAETVERLAKVYADTSAKNVLRTRYYDMEQRVDDLGISVPPHLRGLRQSIGWPKKAVESLAARSQFDGYTCIDDEAASKLQEIVAANGMKRKYRKLVRNELKHSCAFMTVTATGDGRAPRPLVSAYPATAAAALWDYGASRIECGLVVSATAKRGGESVPVAVDVYTAEAVIGLRNGAGGWAAEYRPHSMGRCLMEPMAHDATLEKPFGTSRITKAVMDITDDAVRASRRAEIAAEFMTAPQKYLLGADKDALDGLSKWDAYIGAIFAVSKDGDNDTPQFGQLPQGTLQPHIDYMRALAARFSSETNVPLSELGIVSDNPSSAEAIYAAKESMIVDAQNLNADNAEALRDVALMALAVADGTDFETQAGRGLGIRAKFKNPAIPSVASQGDAILKAIQAFPWMAESDVALEEAGFGDDQIQRLRNDRAKAAGRQIVAQYAGGLGIASDPARAAEEAARDIGR